MATSSRRKHSRSAISQTQKPIATTVLRRTIVSPLAHLELQRRIWENAVRSTRDNRTHFVQRYTAGAITRKSLRLNPDTRGTLLRKTIPAALKFAEPGNVSVCVRRRTRRQVLHALKRTRKGAGSKRRRLNSYSRIHC